jgi:predicted nucleic acid-binding protein
LAPDKDAPILAAAAGAKVAVLLTGDLRHFGGLTRRSDLPLRIRTVRAFLAAPNE